MPCNGKMDVHFSSDKMDWETPDDLFKKLDQEFHFTLDVCATKHNKKCKRFFSPEDDGLSQDWSGEVCWMNPPYGREIKRWVDKAYTTTCSECICVCLLPVRSDTQWWHNFVMKSAEIRFLTKRLSFQGSNNKAPFPAVIVVFSGKNTSYPKLGVVRL
jgi:phage N-6-adenine-methyltransferase